MQIAMVGTDGIVLASDTKWAYGGDIRHTSGSSKIHVNDAGTLAVSFARSMEYAEAVALQIIREMTTAQDWERPILRLEEIAQALIDKDDDPARLRRDAQCLVISRLPEPCLHFIFVGTINSAPWRACCRRVDDKAVAGDQVNAAVYWSERFYSKYAVAVLSELAAQVVVSAASLNPAGIGGLEMVVCRNDGIARLPETECAAMEQRARDREAAFSGGIAVGR
jgi:hypothetical protein